MTDEQVQAEALERLEHIEEDLDVIKNNTPGRYRAFVYGLWHGVGALVGGIVGLTLIGWLLTALGVLPGVSELVPYLEQMVNNAARP
jgi:hypothetical protein